ncbi:MAG TPA: response regulator transcription factor [Gemmatimonadaceae bacterium]|nr:response regulator transcription factor [Gemmatimonadaceae bacterium]
MPGDLIRVILVDDHAVVRTGLKALLGKERDLDVVGEAANGADGIALAERLKPDVILMDLSMATMDGLEATKAIVAKKLPSRVLILTMHAEEEYVVPLMEAGAAGYVLKTAPDRDVVDAVRAVARGDLYVRPEAARALAKGYQRKDPLKEDRARYEKLTSRERDVLRLVAQGYSAPEIGERLNISPKTVDTYKQRIEDKLGLGHRHDYVQFALRLGLLQDS